MHVCIDNAHLRVHVEYMNKRQSSDGHIRLRAQPWDALLDQTTIYVDAEAYRKILDWMEEPATAREVVGMKKLLAPPARR